MARSFGIAPLDDASPETKTITLARVSNFVITTRTKRFLVDKNTMAANFEFMNTLFNDCTGPLYEYQAPGFLDETAIEEILRFAYRNDNDDSSVKFTYSLDALLVLAHWNIVPRCELVLAKRLECVLVSPPDPDTFLGVARYLGRRGLRDKYAQAVAKSMAYHIATHYVDPAKVDPVLLVAAITRIIGEVHFELRKPCRGVIFGDDHLINKVCKRKRVLSNDTLAKMTSKRQKARTDPPTQVVSVSVPASITLAQVASASSSGPAQTTLPDNEFRAPRDNGSEASRQEATNILVTKKVAQKRAREEVESDDECVLV